MIRERLDELVSDAESAARSLLDREEFDSDALETLDDLTDVADEAEDLLSTVDVTELTDALDLRDLPEAVDLEDLPEAIEEQSPREAVRLRKLIQLADLSHVLASTDLRRFRSEKDELEDELDDLSNGGSDGEGTGDGRLHVGDEGRDGGMLGGESPIGGTDVDADALDEDLDDGERSELMQAAVQSKVDDAVSEFREGLVAAHERLADIREENETRTQSGDDQPSSRNPTAFSSLPAGRGDMGGATRYSTVPAQVRHSGASSRERVYGDRFEGWSDDG